MPSMITAGFNSCGNSPSKLDAPKEIFEDEARTLYVANSQNHQLQWRANGAASGETVVGTGASGSSLSQLSISCYIVVDSIEYMYITDSENDRILRWTRNSTSGECIVACTGIEGGDVEYANINGIR
ncbi:unnamed protein product [Rotaria magnacalcarata]|nr:unnamed protein product [Rotaria magnacalcarata]CAF4315364.1 unnamed protein product [Rotaria magnacalcarata]